MPVPVVIVVRADPSRPTSKLNAVKLIRVLGLLRPGIAQKYGLRDAKWIADALLDHEAAVKFEFTWDAEPVARPALQGMFSIVDDDEDLAAEDLWIEAGLKLLEGFANAAADDETE